LSVLRTRRLGRRMSRPLEDYGIIGNMLTAALVARDGSIDWLCLPRFDSAACFAALLGGRDNGRWQIAPAGDIRHVRRTYRDDTAILETTFEVKGGTATVIDFMPPTDDDAKLDLVRLVRGEKGAVAMAMELVLRFGYGAITPWVQRRDYGL